MGSVGAPEILVILVLALIVLGPDRLPQAARTMGRWIGELRRLTGSLQAEVRDVVDEVMRPVIDTASVAGEAFTSTFSSTSAAAPTASTAPSSAETGDETGDETDDEEIRMADVPMPADVIASSPEPSWARPVPPADPSLN